MSFIMYTEEGVGLVSEVEGVLWSVCVEMLHLYAFESVQQTAHYDVIGYCA